MSPCCSICYDEDEGVVFNCSNYSCDYQLCGSCVRDAFKDSSGSNSSYCQFCQTPSAMDMIAAVCGPHAIKAIEQKMRSSIEFELRTEMLKKEKAKEELSGINEEARKIFIEITDSINLKCPRCQMVFHDYDGCNALVCSKASCKAAFCAVCLKDCGRDAHEHVRKIHGNYFDREAFEKSKVLRINQVVSNVMRRIDEEPFELKQLVKNHIDKAGLVDQKDRGVNFARRSEQFIREAKESLHMTTQMDRLSILNDPSMYQRQNANLTRDDISPRCAIPDDFRILLRSSLDVMAFELSIEQKDVVSGKWKRFTGKDAGEELRDADILLNLTQSIKCAVIAFENNSSIYQSRQQPIPKGKVLDGEKICMSLVRVRHDGSLIDGNEVFNNFESRKIIGYNPNLRYLMLEKHVIQEESHLMFPALKNLLGEGRVSPILTEILRPVPDSQATLNEQQKQVAHPLRLKTANEVAGPPGTGKTKTIVELVRSLLECTNHEILVLSERNGAINAVAEKFKEVSIKVLDKMKVEICDPLVWLSLLTYGAGGDTMGECTKMFTLEEKLRYHPDLVELKEKMTLMQDISRSLAASMRDILGDEIEDFGDAYVVDRAEARCRAIKDRKNESLSTPHVIIRYVEEVVCTLKKTLPSHGGKKLTEEQMERVVLDYSEILGGLFDIRTDPQKKQNPKLWNRRESTIRLNDICRRLERILHLDQFKEENALNLRRQLSQATENVKAAETRLKEELSNHARLHMSTIGSSHKLPIVKRPDITDMMGSMYLEDSDSEEQTPKNTVVIFDEAGCIPSYELLGLSRLGRDIDALVLVGDKHQLPPYNPFQCPFQCNDKKGRTAERNRPKELKSLLDVSALTIDDSKVQLTVQYRVPKDIAEILNSRVYKGLYNTCPQANVPLNGLHVVHVDEDPNPRKKYVNSNEVEKGLHLFDRFSLDHRIDDILIITPYKNQQREFQYQMKKKGISCPVLTIDQVQGQESDAVILSLVRKPTRFLNKNRLNVALSRVRKKLYVLVDKTKLREACRNSNWESNLLAGDLLD